MTDDGGKRLKTDHPKAFSVASRLRHPFVKAFGWLYGAYLTLRFVDKSDKFPAILFSNRLLRLRIKKGAGARLEVHGRLIVEPWLYGKSASSLHLAKGASIRLDGDFLIGDDVQIWVSPGATLGIGGRLRESASGITARSRVLVNLDLQIGRDVIVAYDTFITDSDWHPIDGRVTSARTQIGDHVWIAVGAKILKGARIGDNSIVASQAVVIHGTYPPHSMLGGVPARVVKRQIGEWHRSLSD